MGFLLGTVAFCIKDVVLDLFALQHTAQRFGDLNRGGPYKYRLSFCVVFLNFVDDRVEFLTLGFENQVIKVVAGDGLVGWYHNHFHLIDFVEFFRFRLSCTCHPGQFVVHPEVVLQRDGSIRLRGRLNFYILFGFDCLMQSIGVTPAGEYTSRVLINNHNLVFLDDVVDVLFKQGVRFQ